MTSLPLLLAAVLAAAPQPKPDSRPIILATTTSFQDTGLLDVLVKKFAEQGGGQVKAIAVGTGEALAMGERGDADVLVVHAPKSEDAFMAAGHGRERRALWHNDFLVVGPKPDPAGIRGARSAVEAFKKIAAAPKAVFASRGDKSGTHKKEQDLMAKAGLEKWPNILSTGQGMVETLRIASERQAYSLTDRGSWLVAKPTLDLDPLVEGDAALSNPYHVIEVDPAKHPNVNAEGARKFAQFLVSPETQKLVGEFGKVKFGQALFVPDAKP
ncbi:MAG TPA: substrate-binding domain-containing protein [Myxococcales bacterium]|jgi:tungstate transport system substrate-binding protein